MSTQPVPTPRKYWPRAIALMLLALGTALGIAACDGKEVKGQSGPGGGPGSGRGAARPVAITAAPVVQKAVPIRITGPIGTVEPIQSVTIKARIGGQIEKVHFTEGQDVKQGDPLFTIDRRPLEMDLAQAEANLKRDEAQAENARNEAKRYNDLNKRNAVAAADYDKIQTAARALEATVAAERAAVASAKLQLEYTEITAPITGRTGSLVVDPGNLVKANDSDLVTINQLSPIYVLFSVDENRLPQIRRAMADHVLTVTATIPNDDGPPEEGKLTFINNTVTAGTGQILLRGTFANKNHRLWPGQFVTVMLELATQKDAIVCPASAVQNGQDGTFVFVIRPDMTVESRPVTIDRQLDSTKSGKAGAGSTVEKEVVIAQGLKAGEQVVTDGQLQLVPNQSKVEIKGEGQGPAAAKGTAKGGTKEVPARSAEPPAKKTEKTGAGKTSASKASNGKGKKSSS